MLDKTPTPFLATGFYTAGEVARLLGGISAKRVRAWSVSSGRTRPVIDRDYRDTSEGLTLSFLDMVEIRCLAHFRSQGFSLQGLRRAMVRARDLLGAQHPLALASTRFLSDRRRIFLEAAKESGDRFILDLQTDQFAFYDVIERSLAADLEFGTDDLAVRWHPQPNAFPSVWIDPCLAYGHPVVMPERVPTMALHLSVDGGNAVEAVANWFDVAPERVAEAHRFEVDLQR